MGTTCLRVPRRTRTCTSVEFSVFAPFIFGWRRYIDDILILWTGPLGHLDLFLKRINKNTFNMYYAMTWRPTEVSFLDLSIKIESDNTITTILCRKRLAGNSTLHASSQHPKHLRKGIPTGQYLRIRRNCTHFLDFQREAEEILGLACYSMAAVIKVLGMHIKML